MGTFREFEHAGWEDPATCAAYHAHLGAVVAQSIEPLLDAARVAEPGRRRVAAGVGEPERVLDVATGAGVVAAAATRRGAVVLGVDFSAEQLRRARAEHAGLGFVRGDAGALPLGDASVDVVVSNYGVPHFPAPERFLREAARVLRRTGRLAFTVWTPPARSPVFAALFEALARYGTLDVGLPPGPDFFRYADPATATLDLTAAGFADMSVTDVAQTWKLPSAADVVDGLLHGTVRMGALLRGQSAGVLDRVRRSVAERLASYDDGDAARIPMPAAVVRATKP
jgi:ubiquinone/menaquinone biosynthesis C-methylase UbiE